MREVTVSPDFSGISDFVKNLPENFDTSGVSIYKGRNELKEFDIDGIKYVVKSFRLPHILNRFVYRFFRSSKAQRSYEYANELTGIGLNTPKPVGYVCDNSAFLLNRSFYVSLKSGCRYTFRDLEKDGFPDRDKVLKAVAGVTAKMHENGMLHKDYSTGNILFDFTPQGDVYIEIIDLNRMRFGHVSMDLGCRNFDRLQGTVAMFDVMAREYARLRGFDAKECLKLMIKYNNDLNETD